VWDVTPFSLVEVNVYETARRHIPKESVLFLT
jgi:hypothetical protein